MDFAELDGVLKRLAAGDIGVENGAAGDIAHHIMQFRCEPNDPLRVVRRIVGAILGRDPVSLFSPPYHDELKIRSDLSAAGFAQIRAATVSEPSRAASAPEAATIVCHGSVLRTAIKTHDPGRFGEITNSVTEALLSRFGTGVVEGRTQALLVSAERPTAEEGDERSSKQLLGNILERYDRGLAPVLFSDFAKDAARRVAGFAPAGCLRLAPEPVSPIASAWRSSICSRGPNFARATSSIGLFRSVAIKRVLAGSRSRSCLVTGQLRCCVAPPTTSAGPRFRGSQSNGPADILACHSGRRSAPVKLF